MKWVALVFVGLFAVGQSDPVDNCETLLKPIDISYNELLGKWHYISGTSDLPGSRSLVHLMTSAWIDSRTSSQSNVLELIQAQRILGRCSAMRYNATFENNILLIEQPFYLKEVYLPTECADCLSIYENVASGKDNFTSLILFSKSRTVPATAVEMFKKQGECLKMPSLIMTNDKDELCPDDTATIEGLPALNAYLEAKMGHQLAKVLDSIFDFFIN